jgi:hypothetical protein
MGTQLGSPEKLNAPGRWSDQDGSAPGTEVVNRGVPNLFRRSRLCLRC